MKSVLSWFINIMAVAFWIFRVVVVLGDAMHLNLPVTPLDASVEIPLLFVTVACLLLIFKKKLLGAFLYVAIYLGYFGVAIYSAISGSPVVLQAGKEQEELEQQVVVSQVDEEEGEEGKEILASQTALDAVVAGLGIIIAVASLIDIVATTDRTSTRITKKTDWFFNNKEFDRKIDERADKNNYRIM